MISWERKLVIEGKYSPKWINDFLEEKENYSGNPEIDEKIDPRTRRWNSTSVDQ
jgi:hypothetical protein